MGTLQWYGRGERRLFWVGRAGDCTFSSLSNCSHSLTITQKVGAKQHTAMAPRHCHPCLPIPGYPHPPYNPGPHLSTSGAISPCPSNTTSGLVFIPGHGAHQGGSTCGPMSLPSLRTSMSLVRCPMPRADAAPVLPSCPAPAWGGGIGPVCQDLPWWTPWWLHTPLWKASSCPKAPNPHVEG